MEGALSHAILHEVAVFVATDTCWTVHDAASDVILVSTQSPSFPPHLVWSRKLARIHEKDELQKKY